MTFLEAIGLQNLIRGGASPELMLAAASTPEERLARADAAKGMFRRELTAAVLEQLAADAVVTEFELAEIRREES